MLAGGCFWGVQAVFQHVKGVSSAVSGYAGGQASTANYDTVSGGAAATPKPWRSPTTRPGQLRPAAADLFLGGARPDPAQPPGPDTGTQYRSAVFPASDGQRQVAEAYIAQLNRAGVYGKPMATTIEPLKAFYRAEDYHQDYLVRHPYSMYIMVNDVPKVENLAKVFPARYQDKPVLVYP